MTSAKPSRSIDDFEVVGIHGQHRVPNREGISVRPLVDTFEPSVISGNGQKLRTTKKRLSTLTRERLGRRIATSQKHGHDGNHDRDTRCNNLAGIFVRDEGLFMKSANKGRFYHDGRFATLMDVVNHYNTLLHLGLTSQEKRDVIEYLKSLPEE